MARDAIERAARVTGSAQDRRVRGKKVGGTRLRKLVCSADCGFPPLRCSRAAIAAGLPTCPCGELLWPWDVEDVDAAHAAGHLSDEQRASHPLVIEFERQCNSVAKGQAWTGSARQLQDPAALALLRVAESVAESNREAKLAAARRLAKPDEIPF